MSLGYRAQSIWPREVVLKAPLEGSCQPYGWLRGDLTRVNFVSSTSLRGSERAVSINTPFAKGGCQLC